ncbi:tetratricopeptide repeat protein [Flavobacterium cheniae]|uniref:Tetratricopeptide repeat protein n=1 Tax=Flavobacterium cheniae TaxID=295428 RepID=A0A562KFR7_9FLAO|nr:tetratricopeptide repeat protein [Flavobacterium cheniae]TDR20960.1 tetratricopeptide repeat protein [Flavobacterium cheniae]TWH94164.1 tetratricopeptide repeat protein [Flavobacterium cheniae]
MRKIVYILLLLNCITLFSQEKDKNLYNGNQSFTEKKYVDSEADYRVTESKKSPKKAVAGYNLGNSIYRQNQQGEAQIKYIQALEVAKTKEEKHRIYHNLGNTFMLEKKYDLAADAYKNALRNNPKDEETRYNYALAKRKNKDNPPPKDNKKDNKGGGGQDNKPQPKDKDGKNDKGNDKKDSDKDNQNNKDKQGDKQQGKGDGEKKEDKNENPKPSSADKQRIDNILDAVNNAEKKVQDKVNAKKVKARPVSNEKDW